MIYFKIFCLIFAFVSSIFIFSNTNKLVYIVPATIVLVSLAVRAALDGDFKIKR